MRKITLPIFGAALALMLVDGSPARADDCDTKAEAMTKAVATMIETSEERDKITGQIAEGLAACKRGDNDPWAGVDPRVTES